MTLRHNPCFLHTSSPKDLYLNLKDSPCDKELLEELFSTGLPLLLRMDGVDIGTFHCLAETIAKTGVRLFVIKEKDLRNKDLLMTGTFSHFHQLIDLLKGKNEIGEEISEALSYYLKDSFSIKVRKGTIEIGPKTIIMGILNITPDSFSDGGIYFNIDQAISNGERLAEEGANILDIGGESTRPGARTVSASEEISRVIPVIEALSKKIKVPISIDTYKAEVAKRAIEAGAEIVNDVSALRFDPSMVDIVLSYKVPLILMHMKGMPLNMQQDPYYGDVVSEIFGFLRERIEYAEAKGVDPSQIIVDPGIGFGKSLERNDNLKIIRSLGEFKSLGKPILVGVSRKAFIGKILGTDVHHRLEGTAGAVALSILYGANIVRVHDVKAMKRVATMVDAIRGSGKEGNLFSG